MYKNSEGYSSPTEGEALSRITKEERAAKKAVQKNIHKNEICKKIYVVSKYAGDVEKNVSYAITYCKFVIAMGHQPIASHLLYPQMLDDNVPEERHLGCDFGMNLLRICDEVWVFGSEYSKGMEAEVSKARQLGMMIRNFTDDTLPFVHNAAGVTIPER